MNKVDKESKNNGIANGKEVSSSDLLYEKHPPYERLCDTRDSYHFGFERKTKKNIIFLVSIYKPKNMVQIQISNEDGKPILFRLLKTEYELLCKNLSELKEKLFV